MSGERRVACVNVPALSLQILLRDNPGWRDHPMAVVDRDAPTGRVLSVSQRAWDLRIRPGLRYASALSLSGELRAAVVAPSAIEDATGGLLQTLRRFSPAVECSQEHAGLFWLNATGLGRLYASLESWADAVSLAIDELGYRATVVVGFERFAVSALALARYRSRIVASPDEERAALLKVPLERLEPSAAALHGLERLGVKTVGDLLRLPRSQVVQRFGETVERLYRQAREESVMAVQATNVPLTVRRAIELGYPARDVARIESHICATLPGMIGQLIDGDDLIAELRLCLELERGPGERDGARIEERIRPASPTLDEALILELVRLRLEALPLGGGVVAIELTVAATRARREQPSLLAARPKRDLAAADRALARVRAEVGDAAVGTLTVGDGHLPEARTVWTPLVNLRHASPQRALVLPLIRRLSAPPEPLPPRARHAPDGWLVRGPEFGPVIRCTGPHVLEGGWWATTTRREYHFLETARGHLLWAFYDDRRRRWFLHGVIE